MTRRLATCFLLAASLAVSVAGPAAAQSAKVSTDPALRRTAEALLVWTLVGVDQARKTNNVAVLRALGTPDFRRKVSAGRLRAMLKKIKARDFDDVHAWFKRFPGRLSFSRLQKLGVRGLAVEACYCPEGYHLFFAMRFLNMRGQWRIRAMKVWDHVD